LYKGHAGSGEQTNKQASRFIFLTNFIMKDFKIVSYKVYKQQKVGQIKPIHNFNHSHFINPERVFRRYKLPECIYIAKQTAIELSSTIKSMYFFMQSLSDSTNSDYTNFLETEISVEGGDLNMYIEESKLVVTYEFTNDNNITFRIQWIEDIIGYLENQNHITFLHSLQN